MILHITHNDMDGAGCAILVKKCFENVHTAYLNYHEVDEYIKENYRMYDRIIISDVTPSIGTIETLKNKCNLFVIDHHKTSEKLKKFDFTIHDLSKSATLLTFDWLLGEGHNVEAYRGMAECINDYDIWLMERADSLTMNIMFTLFGIGRFVNRFLENPSDSFTETEQILLDIEKENQDKYIQQAANNTHFFRDNRGRETAVVFAERYNSELGNHMIVEENLDYIIIINAQKDKVSLRSRADVDISEIAVANGGGGHKNASGFSTEFDFGLEIFLKGIGVYS